MDSIKLERVEPFNNSSAKQKSAAPSRVTTFNNVAYKYQHGEVNGLFQKLRTKTCEPQPIPPQVIPVMEFNEQVEKYEKMFLNDGKLVDNLTIQELMIPFNECDVSGGKNPKFGKFLFLNRFFHKVINQNMNYDAALICNDRRSEDELFAGLNAINLNVRAMSNMFERKVYGVMVKIRKNVKNRAEFTPIFRNTVDAIFVYDSACGLNVENAMNLLRGIRFDDPTLFFLACMDTAEIRIHIYNRSAHGSDVPISWDTKVCDLDHDLQQMLLLQPNRLPEYVATIAWNDHLSQTLLNWVSDKENILYQYKLPTRGGLLNEVNTFLLHHPPIVSTLPAVHTDVIAIRNSVAARDVPPVTKVVQPTAWAARPAVRDVRPVVRNERSFIRPDSIPSLPVKPVKPVIPAVKATATQHKINPAAKSNVPAVKAAARSLPAKNTGVAVIGKPSAVPVGIHPERMAMIEGNTSLLSAPPMNTIERKRERENQNEVADITAKKPKSLATAEANEDSAMEDTRELPTSSSTIAPTSNADDKDPKSLASDFAKSFDAFFTNALQKFEDDILNIKF